MSIFAMKEPLVSLTTITVNCLSCDGGRTMIFDHAMSRVEGYCPRCQPDPITSHLTLDLLALKAGIEQMRAEVERLRAVHCPTDVGHPYVD